MKDFFFHIGHPAEEFKELRDAFGGEISGTTWTYDGEFGKGFMEYHELEPGLFLYLFNDINYQPHIITRIPCEDSSFLTLNIGSTILESIVSVKEGKKYFPNSNKSSKRVFLTSSNAFVSFKQDVGVQHAGIKIAMNKAWLVNKIDLSHANKNNIVSSLIQTTDPVYLFEYLNKYSEELMNELFRAREDKVFGQLRLLAICLKLIHVFFEQLISRDQPQQKIHYTDFNNILNATASLTAEFDKTPPTINQLAKSALMSPTKFRQLFKQIHGQTFYQYYQLQRMNRANEILLTGRYSISDVADKVGYLSTSKFSDAYRKQFGTLPNDVYKK